jgi:DNA (cytosine-5)-methyltransferase 1
MSPLRYLSVCSGIEAASVAWTPLGFDAVAFSEIEPFPCAVLKHHYPTVPNYGDLTRFREWPDAAFDVLVGGTPCQSFSVAGLRAGLADPRGNLALTYLAVAERYRPKWVVWENVPGVLSSISHPAPDACPPAIDLDSVDGPRDGEEVVVEDEYDTVETHAFACFLAGLSELGYRWAYGSLDAQYFDLAQRRLRVFVVGHLGDWRRAAAVLFERASLSGHPAPSREAGEGIAATLTNGFGERGVDADQIANGNYSLAPTIPSRSTAGGGLWTDFDCDGGLIHCALVPVQCNGTNVGMDLPSLRRGDGGLTSGVPAVAFDARQSDVIQYGDKSGPLDTDGHTIAVAFAENQRAELVTNNTAGSLKVGGRKPGQGYPAIQRGMQVRRLTPRECERLQGFPDDYTLIPYRGKPAADGPRYKALGNSMAVPVMAWIGKRIAMVEAL